jgi:hypothetical protein
LCVYKNEKNTLILRKYLFFFILFFEFSMSYSQDFSRESNFSFLNIPHSSRHQYLNKCAIASYDADISLAGSNPALLNNDMIGKILASSNFYFSSIYSNISYVTWNNKWDVPLMFGGNFIAYPEQRSVDIEGNALQKFTPVESSFYISTKKQFGDYHFGASAKLAYGNYYLANNVGIAFDASVLYSDDDRNIQVAFLLKNMGYQFISTGGSTAAMPFDAQIAFSKRLSKLPFRYTIMAHNLFKSDASTTVNALNTQIWAFDHYIGTDNSFISSVMSHFVFSGEFLIGTGFKAGFSYDCRRAEELTFSNYRGIPGLALGFGIYSRKYELGYSFSKLSAVSIGHQITFVLNMRDWASRKSKRR